MCGRVNVSDNEGIRLLLESMNMPTWPSQTPRFNIAPSQTLKVVSAAADTLSLTSMQWGFTLSLPGKSGKRVTRTVQNARSDKLWHSPLWQRSIEHKRVLVPVNGFYEWRRKNRKLDTAFYITAADQPALFLAGIYRAPMTDSGGKPEVSVVTTEASVDMARIHDRMPVIFTSDNQAMAWLQVTHRQCIDDLIAANESALSFLEVSQYVNKSTNEGPQCVAPVAY